MRTLTEWRKFVEDSAPRDSDDIRQGFARMVECHLELQHAFLDWWREQERKIHPVFIATLRTDGTYSIHLDLQNAEVRNAPPK